MTRPFEHRVLAQIDRWNMLPEQSHVGIAVSGGADSVALFRTLHSLAAQRRWRLTVLHVNHKLRGAESDGDASFVQALANQYDTPFYSTDLPIAAAGNLEQEARHLRCAWLKRCTILHNLDRIALGHTRSDQAETVLFRLLRGTGSAGLSAIRPIASDGFIRPLLGVTREEIRAQLCTIGQSWREDSSNRDLRFDRNRIRLDLLPALARDWNPAIEATLAQIAEWALGEEEYWDSAIGSLAGDYLTTRPGPTVIVNAIALSELPVAVCRRLIRRAIVQIRGDLRGIGFTHVEQIRLLAAGIEGTGRLQIPGGDILRSFDWLRFAPPGGYGVNRESRIHVTIPGQISLSANNLTLTFRVIEADYLYNGTGNCLDSARIADRLVLRTWQPGDRYRPVGYPAAVKVKTLFQESRIPLWERGAWPVLVRNSADSSRTEEDAIVWTRKFGVAADAAPAPGTSKIVIIEETDL